VEFPRFHTTSSLIWPIVFHLRPSDRAAGSSAIDFPICGENAALGTSNCTSVLWRNVRNAVLVLVVVRLNHPRLAIYSVLASVLGCTTSCHLGFLVPTSEALLRNHCYAVSPAVFVQFVLSE
jgi:hypothetical protein